MKFGCNFPNIICFKQKPKLLMLKVRKFRRGAFVCFLLLLCWICLGKAGPLTCTVSSLDRYKALFRVGQCSNLSDGGLESHPKATTTDSKETDKRATETAHLPKCRQNLGSGLLAKLRATQKYDLQEFQKVTDRKIYVFSAYYEPRPLADGPAVRILAVGWQAAYNDIGNIYCQFWYDRSGEVSVQGGQGQYKVIYRSTSWPHMWVSHFIICKLPDGIASLPFAVSVTPEPCVTLENIVHVQNTHKPSPPTDGFGVCISTIYNNFNDWLTVLEWVELNKILGANEITFYNLSASDDTNAILHSYLSDPDDQIRVNVVDWKIPAEVAESNSYFIQRLVFNDCLYRTAYKQKYVSIQDIDEILVPKKYDNWPELFSEIAKPAHGIYMFQHAYFRRNTTHALDYITQSSFWRTDKVAPPGKIRCKSFYNALLAVSVDIHFHYELVRGSHEYMMAPEEGILHHYRIDPMESFRRNPSKYVFIEDRYMEIYKVRLLDNVERRVQKMGGWKVFQTENRSRVR